MEWPAPILHHLRHPEFLQSYERARDIRANAAFAEQQLAIADNVSDDWSFNPDSSKLSVKKEAMLRSKLRIRRGNGKWLAVIPRNGAIGSKSR